MLNTLLNLVRRLEKKINPRTLLTLAVISLLILLYTISIAKQSTIPDPSQPAMETGWKTEGSITCYTLSDGSNATGWQEIDGKTYYFRSSGAMVTGWQNLDSQIHYFLEDGSAASGSLIIGDDLHHFTKNGIPATGWYEYQGKNIYLDSTGIAYTGWYTIEDRPYYFDEAGFPCSGWLEEDGKTYYLNEDGAAALGRNVIDEKVHYFASTGEEILLVNSWNHIPEDYTVALKKLPNSYQVAADAYPDLQEMLNDCKEAGCKPVICSAYRTQEYQEKLFTRKIKRLKATGLSQEQAEQQAATVVAIPGTSEHQLGLALDIIDDSNWTLDASQEKTKTQQWLMAHSWEYGWILRYPNGKTEVTGIIYEPWHYRYVGREIAAELHKLDMCLEEYLQMLTDTVG